jgi:hypothetical protein
MGDLVIDFITRHSDYPGYYLYTVNITNKGNIPIAYDMAKLKCNAGKNVLALNPEAKINSIKLLNKGILEQNETIEGLVCIVPDTALHTNSPIFYFGDEKLKVDLQKEKRLKVLP